MKKVHAPLVVSRFVVPALVLLASAAVVRAQDAENLGAPSDFPLVGEITAEDVQLRAGPSTDYRVLRKLEPREKVVVVASEGDWFEVRVPAGFSAYVLGRLLDPSGDGSATVRERRVNLRPTPSTRYFPAGQVTRGEKLRVLETKDGWAKVLAPEHVTAWVSQRYVQLVGPESDHEVEISELSARARSATIEKSVDPEQAAAQAQRIEVEKTFRQAEALYRSLHPDPMAEAAAPDFTEAVELYEKVRDQEILPILAEKARLRLEAIAREQKRAETLQEVREIRTELEEELAKVQQDYQEATRQIQQSEDPVPTKREGEVGWIVRNIPLNPFDKTQPTHKLVKGGRTLLYLTSDKYDLRDFIDRQVRVTGDFAESVSAEIRHLVVRRLEILSAR